MKDFQRQIVNSKANYVKDSALMYVGNANTIADIILTGVCDRFPRLKFVSVESGASWLPFLVESLDWQWLNSGAKEAYSDRLMPSEYFRRQVFGSFWFERDLLRPSIELYPNNLMFETDYPHPTSLSPGPASYADNPRSVIESQLRGLPHETISKVLHDTAAEIYHLTSPTLRPQR